MDDLRYTLRRGLRAMVASYEKLWSGRYNYVWCDGSQTRGATVITEERVRDQLRNVIDPEIGMDLVELGLIYDVGVHDEGRHLDVTFSLTSPMCPVGDLIQEQVETEALSIEGVETVNAQLTFEPMWSPEMMSPAAKLFFGR